MPDENAAAEAVTDQNDVDEKPLTVITRPS